MGNKKNKIRENGKKYHNMTIAEIINLVTTLGITFEEFLNENSSKYIDEYKKLMKERDESDVWFF